jgi:hypothetical protein
VVGIGAIAALFIPARAGARNMARRPDDELFTEPAAEPALAFAEIDR